MVLLFIDVKQCQMEFGGDNTDMFVEGIKKTRFQSSWTGSPVGNRVEK